MALIGTQGPAAVLDARACAWLEHYANLTALRVRVRGTDLEISKQLEDIRVAALHWRSSATGTERDTEPELAAKSEWLSTGQVAHELMITDRAVRKAIAEERLPATVIGGRYRISREDLEHYRAARAA